MEVKAGTAAELFLKAAQVHEKRVAFGTRLKSRLWKPTTFGEVYEEGACLATALIDMGLERGEHVGLIADNRIEWIISNCGIQLAGAADVPRGTDLTDSDITYILPHADVRICFIENVEMWKRVSALKSELPNVETYILMNLEQEAPEGVLHLKDLIEKGKDLRKAGDRRAEERAAQVQPEDLSTIIYTSGTTGAPKGVMLQHSNIMYMIDCIPVDLGAHDRALSILPVWHIFERALEMFSIAKGCSTYYSSIRMLGDDLKNVQPTFMGSAPRLWEVLYMRILDNAQAAHPVRRFLFHTGYGLAEIYKNSLFYLKNRKLHLHKPNPLVFSLGWLFHLVRWLLVTPLYGFFNVAVLERIRQAAGASLKATISGGGALPRHVDQFFNYVGIPVLEGYGMTETAGPITARTVDKLVIETVGPVLKGVEIRIVDLNHGEVLFPNSKNKHNGRGLRGEIHVRGPIVMRGYYKNQEATDKVMKDGWMNTGDIGMMTFNDCLKILGRSKDTIVLSSGENIEPVPIENRLLQSPLVDHVVVVGQDEKSLGALIVPSVDGFQSLGYESMSVAELANHPEIEAKVSQAIKQEISSENGFKSFERITTFKLVPKPFEAADELTAKLSLRRHVITEKYQHLIDEMYGRAPSEKNKAAR